MSSGNSTPVTITPLNVVGSMLSLSIGKSLRFDGYTIKRVAGGFFYVRRNKEVAFVPLSAVQSEAMPK